jgi:hypothetical protein
MAISKFGLACIAAVLAGGATAGLAASDATPAVSEQVADAGRATPISAINDPQSAFKDVSVQFVSGKSFGHVVAVATDGAGHASRIRIALDDMPSQLLWLDKDDLVYSRSHDVIVAHDVHPPAMDLADAR